MRLSVMSALLAIGLTSNALAAHTPSDSGSVSITHISVVDTSSGRVRSDMTVAVSGGRIVAVEPSKRAKVPGGTRSIDGTGRYLIPGLWDMHAHAFLEGAAVNNLVLMPTATYFRLFLANGVTGFRDMGGTETPEQIAELHRVSADGGRMVPKFTAGVLVDGPQPIWPFSSRAATADEGRAVAHDVQSGGFDFVKVYSALPRDVYFAIADEARQQHFVFAGHVPNAVTALEASNAGQKSIEHLGRILNGCSSREDEFNARYRYALAQGESTAPIIRDVRSLLLPSYDQAKATALFQTFAHNRTWQVPTFTVLRVLAKINDPAFTNDPRLQYIPAAVRKSWDPSGDFRFKDVTPEEWKLARDIYAKYFDVVREMHRVGVPILAGTDVGNNFVYPGFSLHDELGFLVKAGLSPLEALQSATSQAARFMGNERDFGSIETGKVADLVILDANPLQDIENVRRIRGVVLSGVYFDRGKLDELLKEVRDEAQETASAVGN